MPSIALGWDGDRVDAHAPIGVMGDHVHEKGEWMLSYRYMHMEMSPNYVGDQKVSVGDIVSPTGFNYMVSPEDMKMDMNMLGLMYAPIDRVTLMAMLPIVTKTMDHVTRPGDRFTTDTAGVGDFKLSALVRIFTGENNNFHATFGFSSPTGSISESDFTPAGGPNTPLPYPMQLGSGTFDLLFAGTYLGQMDRWSWGAQVSGVVRTGRNSRNYRLGDAYEVTGWGAYMWTRWLSTSYRMAWNQNFNITGADPALNPNMISTADPDLRAGRRLDALFGFNVMPAAISESMMSLRGLRLSLEGGLPMYQNLDGPQLGTSWLITTGIQYSF